MNGWGVWWVPPRPTTPWSADAAHDVYSAGRASYCDVGGPSGVCGCGRDAGVGAPIVLAARCYSAAAAWSPASYAWSAPDVPSTTVVMRVSIHSSAGVWA